MPLVALLWLASAFASEPQAPGAPVPAAPPEAEAASLPFATLLERAKSAYFEGRITDALRMFQDLEVRLKVKGETPSWEEAAEAMTYLGEIHLAQGHPERAEEAFRWVLERDIDTPMRSPYRHPMEVVTLFEDVRAKVLRERRELTPPPPRLVERKIRGGDIYIIVPLGLPQFYQRRPFAGVLAASTQLGFGIASYVTLRNLKEFNQAGPPGPGDAALDEFEKDVQTRRYIQLSLGAATYLSYGLSVLDAGIAANKARRRAMLGLSVSPEGSPQLAVHGTL